MSVRFWLIPTVLLTLSLTASAQPPWGKDPVLPQLVGSPTRSDHAQLTADLDPDAIIVEDGEPVVHVSPAVHTARLFFPQGTTTPDIAVLRRSVSEHQSGERDEVLTIGNSGLLAWSWDDDDAEFESRTLGTSAWVGVNRLVFADSNDPNERLVVGSIVSPKAIVLLNAPDTVNETESSFTPARPANDIVLFRRKSSELEIAITTDLGVLLYGLDGSLTGSFLGASGGQLAAATTDPGGDDLIWVRPASGGGQEMVVIENSNGTLTAASPIALGGLGVVSITTADFDHDEDDDVLLNHQANYETHIYTNNEGNFTSSAVRYLYLGPESVGASTNHAEPIVADFDRDGDLDVAMGATADLALHVRYNGKVTASDQAPVLDLVEESESDPYSYHRYCAEPDLATLFLAFQPAIDVPVNATHMEVAVWRHEWASHVTATEAVEHVTIELGVEPLTMSHTFTSPYFTFDPTFFVSARYVELDANDDLLASFPAYVRAICGSIDRTTDAELRWGPAGSPEEIYRFWDTTCQGGEVPPVPDDDTNNVDVKPIPDEDDNGDPNNGNGGG